MDIVTLSGIRKELLLYLDDGPRSLPELKEYFDITSPEISPRIKELLEHNLVVYTGKKYYLTPKGKTIVNKLKPFVDTINVFEQYGDWWDEHDISVIPDEILFRINNIKNYHIIEDELSNNERTTIEMFKIIKNSKMLFGITCTFNDMYPELFLNLAKNNIPISIIISNNVYDMIEKTYREHLEEFLKLDNCKVYVSKNDIKISQIVTDECLFFSMCYKNGKLDLQSNLVSSDQSSINWGIGLFEYYLARSEKIN